MRCDSRIVILGQPNVGKSTFVNALLGGYHSHVANWPGVTVEVKVLKKEFLGKEVCLIDLPGTYSLNPKSDDEKVTVEFLLNEDFDNVIIVADATVPRTLFLVLQTLELLGKGVIALNKADEAEKAGIHINVGLLERRLKKPVILTSAVLGIGVEKVLEEALKERKVEYLEINYGDLEYFIVSASKLLEGKVKGNPRWYAAEFFAGNEIVEEILKKYKEYNELVNIRLEAEKELGDLNKLVAEARWRKLDEILKDAIVYERIKESSESKLLNLLDAVLLHPVLGVVASMFILFGMMTLAFSINTGFPLNVILGAMGLEEVAEALESYSLSGLLSNVFDEASSIVSAMLPQPWGSLIGHGVILGVGTVISFFPLVLTVYLIMALLEDSGIAARIAVALDPLFRPAGLSGKAVFPVVISMGCNVAGVPATRVLRSRGARLASIIALPFIPCQARLVVLLALASVLPGIMKALSIAFVYLLSLSLFILISWIYLRVSGSEREDMVMEVPPYHVPKLKVIAWMAWDNAKHFLKKAGTVILVFSIVLWVMTHTGPSGFVNDVRQSWGFIIGKALAPLAEVSLAVNGKSSWIISFSMLVGAIAKEVVLETLAILTGTSNVKEMVAYLQLTPPQVIALMTAISLYIPCIATLAAIKGETGSWRYVLLSAALSVITALVISSVVLRILTVLW